jgi:hypothetical protein
MPSTFVECVAPYSTVDFSTHVVLVACPTYEKAPGPRTAFAVSKEVLIDTGLGASRVLGNGSSLSASPFSPSSGALGPKSAASGDDLRPQPTTAIYAQLPSGIVEFPQIASEPLRLVLVYLDALAANGGRPSKIPTPLNDQLGRYLAAWEHTFLYGPQGILKGGQKEGSSEVDRILLSEVIIAADFLGIAPLMDLCGAAFAAMLNGRSTDSMRQLWGMSNDFLPEESKKFKEENAWADEAMATQQQQQ